MKNLIKRLAITAIVALLPLEFVVAQNIRIGELSSYSAYPQSTDSYRNGWKLAVKDINASGGVLGKPLEVVSRDDAGRPEVALRAAQDLVTNEHVVLLTGTYLSNVAVAISEFADTNKIFFLAGQPQTDALVWEKGNRYTFRLRNSQRSQALAMARVAAKLPAKRWATIAPNYEFGQSAVAGFKAELQRLRPDVKFVNEQWPTLGKLQAGATVQAMIAAKPDAVFNATFGADLAKFVREGNMRGLFEDRPVLSLLTGDPEYLEPLGDEAPEGWIVTGYPWDQIDTPAHVAFRSEYEKTYGIPPKIGSLIGYIEMLAVKAIIEKAGKTDTESLIAAARGLTFDTPIGPATFRRQDQQSTLGFFIGKIKIENGVGKMVDWKFYDGAEYQLPDDAVRKLRPASANE